MTQTLLDGSFTISHVEPGHYYVIVTQQGYVSPLTSIYATRTEPVGLLKPAKPGINAPKITVQPNLPAAVNVTIERGATVSGTVLYDDGSPATGVRITLLVRAKSDWTPLPSSPVANASYSDSTDDLGRYRISGLPAGEYLLRVHLACKACTTKSETRVRVSAHGPSTRCLSTATALRAVKTESRSR